MRRQQAMTTAKIRAHTEKRTVEVWSIDWPNAVPGTPRRYKVIATDDNIDVSGMNGWRLDKIFNKS